MAEPLSRLGRDFMRAREDLLAFHQPPQALDDHVVSHRPEVQLRYDAP
jgi:hypothetical protein